MLPNVDGNSFAGVTPESAGARPNRLEHYQRSLAIGTAPATARYARVLIVAGGTWTTADAFGARYVFFTRPFFGAVPAGVVDAPPWDPGGAPISDTTDIAVGAATSVYRAGSALTGFAFPAFVPPKSGALYSAVLAGPAFVAAADGTIEVSVQCSVNLSAPSANAVYLQAQFVSNSTSWPSLAQWQDVMITDAGTTKIESRTLTATFDVTAGQAVYVQMFLYRGAASSYGGGGIVEKTASQVFATTDRLYDARWRVVHIKR